MATLPSVCPSSVEIVTNPRILVAPFGDGYDQRAIDGLNNLPRVYSVVWANYEDADIDSLVTFFEGNAGVTPFDWTPPKEVSARSFVAYPWKRSLRTGSVSTLTATFKEDFSL